MYTQLQELYTKHSDKGFVVLAFPCNQFGNQEPGTNDQIKQFVKNEFGITFPVFDKLEVNGPNAHPLFLYLRSQLTGVLGTSVKWNFTKFLCDRKGKPIKRYSPPSKPLSFEEDIVQLLQQPTQ
jgi:glutathione peroxidase